MPEGAVVNQMFAGIAGRYDTANRILSGGMDIVWRKRIARAVMAHHPQTVVDLATGSGDVVFAIHRLVSNSTCIIGLDFCQNMLDVAEFKKKSRPDNDNILFKIGDCQKLPLENDSVDVLTISFGLRNLENRTLGLSEMHRVLRKPHGVLLVLEFTQPQAWFRKIYFAYLNSIAPRLAEWITGKGAAYQYLASSIATFPTKESLSEEIQQAGFSDVRAKAMTLSTVALHEAKA